MKTNRMQRPKTIQAVKDFKFEEKPKETVAQKPIPEPIKNDSGTEETKVVEKKEDNNKENNEIVLEEFQEKKRTLINYFPVHINKKWLSILLLLAILCLMGILSPLVVVIWGEYLPVNEDWVMWGIESRQLNSFAFPCTLLFHFIKVVMLMIFYKGIRRCSRLLSFIAMWCLSIEVVLLLFEILLYWQNVFVFYNLVLYCLFISYIALGVCMVKLFGGTLNKFGVFFIGYSVACIFHTLFRDLGFGYLGVWMEFILYFIEITWIIAMWWVLTRKEVVNEAY